MLLQRESALRLWEIAESRGIAADRFWIERERETWEIVQERCKPGESVACGIGVEGWVVWLGHDAIGYSVRGFGKVDGRSVAPSAGLHKGADGSVLEGWLGWWEASLRGGKANQTARAFKPGDYAIGLVTTKGPAMLAKVASVDSEGKPARVVIDAAGTVASAEGMARWVLVKLRKAGFDALWQAGDTGADGYLQMRSKLWNADRRAAVGK